MAASASTQGPPTVTNARSLQGLMKWLTRAEWRDRFAEVYDWHLLPACRRTGFDAEEVVAILGENWFTTTVWGCAFEDFLTREGADGRNVVDDYLKRRGWKESASARAYMSALRRSVMSLYEVSDIVRDTSFQARDLVRGGDPILISERSATRSLKQWDRIAARVVQLGSQMHISGAVLPYDRDASEKLLKVLRNVAKRTDKEKQKLADLVRCDVHDPTISNAFSQAELLRAAAPAITTVWLIDIIDRATTPEIPEVRNAEGDELLFCTVQYPFAAGASAVLDGLAGQPLVEIPTLEQCMATRDFAPPPRLNLSPQERRTIIHDGLDRHYRGLLDEPIPVLGDKSPRTAVKTAKGRAKVVDWLKTLENHTAQMAGHNDEIATYDFSWLWTELGVTELRR
jgi:hypothetical protein